jgi:quercetin dioxygenase-like cupin family protein
MILDTEMATICGVFVKATMIPAGEYAEQHSHPYMHLTVVTRGLVRLWQDGEHVGDFIAPFGIQIPANAQHHFLAIEDATIVCIHDIATAEGSA